MQVRLQAHLPALPLPQRPVKRPRAGGGVQDQEGHCGRLAAGAENLLDADDGARVPLVLQIQRPPACTVQCLDGPLLNPINITQTLPCKVTEIQMTGKL